MSYDVVRGNKYRGLLDGWINFSEGELYSPPDRLDLLCYGSGYNNWGVQTNQKALAAFAVAAVNPSSWDDSSDAEIDSDRVERALRLLRFCFETHVEGSCECLDGSKWGHTWISALGIERMMHGVDALEEYMTEADNAALRRLLISESDWLLDYYDIVADPDGGSGKNRPESNLWNGAILRRTAMMYPDAPRVSEYCEKGTAFLLNSISVPSDAESGKLFEGRPLSNWHVGANFFDTYALHHHAYLNVGYMVICLSSIAMLHFSFKRRGEEPPEALYHHADDLWELIKRFTFPDGRLCRIGGDTRARYCYCQDYALPMWLFVYDKYGDSDCLEFERSWLDMVSAEVAGNGDGSFLGDRGGELARRSPLYYTRLESDRAVTLSMALQWRRWFDFEHRGDDGKRKEASESEALAPEKNDVKDFLWSDDFHGACFHRNSNRIASWVWESAEKPQGLTLPVSRSDMGEWRTNLFPRITGTGSVVENEVLEHFEQLFDGVFLTMGRVATKTSGHLAEGQVEEVLAEQSVAFAALPDGVSTLCLQYAEAPTRVYIESIEGINLNVPNDIFNGGRRRYRSAEGEFETEPFPAEPETIACDSSWLDIDGVLRLETLYGGNPSIYRSDKREISIRNKERGGGFLYVDRICSPCVSGLRAYDKGAVLVDVGFALRVGGETMGKAANPAENIAVEVGDEDGKLVRHACARGADDAVYLLLANFADTDADIEISADVVDSFKDIASGSTLEFSNGTLRLTLPANSARLLKTE